MATLSDLSIPHFPGNRRRRFPGKWGRVDSGGLVAASCSHRPGQGERTAFKTLVFV